MKPTRSPVPTHIGIIMDGNRRFAKKLMLKPWKGHEWGPDKVKQIMRWAPSNGIKEVTFYTFSVENFNRPKEEFDYLMSLFEREFKALPWDELATNGVRINVIGRTWMFPKNVQDAIKEAIDKTSGNTGFIVNFAMAYGGRQEVVDATKQIASEVAAGRLNLDSINEETFKRYLYMTDEPDMIIRTSGEVRTSDFLPYQGAYAEWFFVEKTWPEFEVADLAACVEEYKQRERRFGK